MYSLPLPSSYKSTVLLGTNLKNLTIHSKQTSPIYYLTQKKKTSFNHASCFSGTTEDYWSHRILFRVPLIFFKTDSENTCIRGNLSRIACSVKHIRIV